MLVALFLVPRSASAQVGASVTLQSDFRYRGRSLSDEKPALGLNLAYDHASGAYLGATATAAKTSNDGIQLLRLVTYAGYVVKPRLGPALDLGFSNYRVADFRGPKRTFDYDEVYAGVLTDHLSFRLNYAPNYYESRIHTLYADLAATAKVRPDTRAFAHVGVLAAVGGRINPATRRKRYDFSAGVAKRLGRSELSLTWVGVSPQVVFSNGRKEAHDTLIVTASYAF